MFAIDVLATVRREGFVFDKARSKDWVRVKVADSQYIGLVCSRSSSPKYYAEILTRVRDANRTSLSVPRTVLVTLKPTSEEARKRMQTSFGLDAIGPSEIGGYLREWQQLFAQNDDLSDSADKTSSPRPKPPTSAHSSPEMELRANSNAIIITTRALAVQLDAKLEALRKDRPNSDDRIAARDAAISEYEELRARVADLENAVATLRKKSPQTAKVAKVGTRFGKTFSRWWSKSGPKVLDKSADAGIVMSSAAILALIGVNPTIAAAIAATVVTRKSMAGILKAK